MYVFQIISFLDQIKYHTHTHTQETKSIQEMKDYDRP